MPSTLNLFKNNITNTLIETGSYIGEGIQNAINAGFNKIISIELSDKYFNICNNKYKNNDIVTILRGTSEDRLKEAIDLAEGKITYWLDGHWSGGDTAKGKHNVPILQELKQIKDSGRKEDIILIDDLEQILEEGISEEKLKKTLTSINTNYIFTKVKGPKNQTTLVVK
jgi:hypothetical protein